MRAFLNSTVFILLILPLVFTTCPNVNDRTCLKGTPVWVDVDTGNDDAMALLTALFNDRLDVVGISTTYGNTILEYATSNTIKILSTFGFLDVPVVRGSVKPLLKFHKHEDTVHGNLGMFGAEMLVEKFLPITDEQDGMETVFNHLQNYTSSTGRKITFLAVGPHTNIAKLLRLHDNLKDYVQRIVFMAGGLKKANITPFAEFNAWTDAEALEVTVTEAHRQQIPLVMVPLEATESQLLELAHIDYIKTLPFKWTQWVGSMLEKLREQTLSYGDPNPTLHDAIAVAYLVRPEIFESQDVHIKIRTDPEHYGQTEVIPNLEPNIKVLTKVDEFGFWTIFFKALRQSIQYTE